MLLDRLVCTWALQRVQWTIPIDVIIAVAKFLPLYDPIHFDPDMCGPHITLYNNNLSATNKDNSTSTVLGNASYHTGKHYWEVRLDQCAEFCYDVTIGISPHLTQGQLNNCWTGAPFGGVGMTAGQCRIVGVKTHDQPQHWETLEEPHEEPKSGDILGLLLDCELRTLTFFLNGKKNGGASLLVAGPWYPAFSVNCSDHRITLCSHAAPPHTD